MPLPNGWSATVERYELDRANRQLGLRVAVRFHGPGGKAFQVERTVPVNHVEDYTPREVVQRLAWPDMREYVLNTIRDQTSTESQPDPDPTIVGAIVQLP